MSVDPNSIPRYSLTYWMEDNWNKLRVFDWGLATGTHLVDVGHRVLDVECWRVLWVEAYVRDFAIGSEFAHEEGWKHWATFPVLLWYEIPRVFHLFFGTMGLYRRVSFHVEEWVWTQEDGWEEGRKKTDCRQLPAG